MSGAPHQCMDVPTYRFGILSPIRQTIALVSLQMDHKYCIYNVSLAFQ